MVRRGGFHPSSRYAWVNQWLQKPEELPLTPPANPLTKLRALKATCPLNDACPRKGLVACRGGRACERLRSDHAVATLEALRDQSDPSRISKRHREEVQRDEDAVELRLRMALASL